MWTVWFVALFCQGTDCLLVEKQLPGLAYDQCLFAAQERVVEVIAEHPTYELIGWRCERRLGT